MFNYGNNLYAVGVGDFIAFKNGKFAAMGKVNTDTSFTVSASSLDIRGGKRLPLLARYFHSSQATFSIISANYNMDIWQASSGGTKRSFANLPKEEQVEMNGRVITLSRLPVAVGDIGAKVWVRYNGKMIGSIDGTAQTLTIPSNGAFSVIPNNSQLCVIYNYKNINASAVTVPAEISPEIWHIFIDVDLATDKSGSGIVGRTVIEIPLGQLDPSQEFSATGDGYSSSKLTGIMLADKSGVGCSGGGVYAYINTEVLDQVWYDDVYTIANDLDNVTLSQGEVYNLNLVGIEFGGEYKIIEKDAYGNLDFTFNVGSATGTTFNNGVITAGSTAGVATLEITVKDDSGVAITRIPKYTLEIEVQ